MKSKVLVVGGGSGLGLQLTNLLAEEHLEVHVLARSKPNYNFLPRSTTYHKTDLNVLDNTQLDQLGTLMASMDAIAFCQRYRPSSGGDLSKYEDAQNEYKVCVQSTAMMIEKMQEKIAERSAEQDNRNPKPLLVIGSTYSSYAGFDQDWSYHAVKSALHGLIRYFAARSNGVFTINMISPPTFMKQGAEEYWKQTKRYKKWERYPSNGLPTANDIAELARVLLLNSNRFMNGQNIICDGGASCLYIDQQDIG